MSEPKPNRSEEARNRADDVRMTLNARFEDKYMFLQLSGPRDGIAGLTDSSQFRGQIVNMQPSSLGEVEDVPTVQQVFALCYVLEFWFAWSEDHVAVVSCRDGLYRSSFFLAAYLAYTEQFPDTVSAFEACSRAICGHNCGFPWRSWRQALVHLAYLVRSPPAPPNVHLIRRIILRMEGLLALVDAPPTVRIVQGNEEIYDSSEGGSALRWDEGALTVDVERIVSGDVQILILADPWEARELSRVRRGERLQKGQLMREAAEAAESGSVEQFKLIARFAWHTSIVPSGLCIPIPVNEKTGMDIFERELIDPNELYMDVLLDEPTLDSAIKPQRDFGLNRCVGLRGDLALWQGAKELSQDHQEIPDWAAVEQCEKFIPSTENGATLAMVASQCFRNDSDAIMRALQLPLFQRLATETFPEYLEPRDPETAPEASPVMDAFSPSPSPADAAREPVSMTGESAVQTTPTIQAPQGQELAIRTPERAEDAVVQTTPSLGTRSAGRDSAQEQLAQRVWERLVSLPDSSRRLQEVLRLLETGSPPQMMPERRQPSATEGEGSRAAAASTEAPAPVSTQDAEHAPEATDKGRGRGSGGGGGGRGPLLAAIRKQGKAESGESGPANLLAEINARGSTVSDTRSENPRENAHANVLAAIRGRKSDDDGTAAATTATAAAATAVAPPTPPPVPARGGDGARANLLAAIKKRGGYDESGAATAAQGETARKNVLSAIQQRKPASEREESSRRNEEAESSKDEDAEEVGEAVEPQQDTASSAGSSVPAKDDPTYGKFFSMLRVGVPQPAVEQKMQAEGLDPAALALDPEQPLPPEFLGTPRDSFEGKLKDHPEIGKFFKMLQVGVPPPAVKMKMEQAKVNPALLDCNPEEPLPESMRDQVTLKATKPKHGGGGRSGAGKRKGPSISRRRLVWDPLPETNDSAVWTFAQHVALAATEGNSEDTLSERDPARHDFDREQFERLFTKTREPSKPVSATAGKSSESSNAPVVLSHKRAMNASIVLSKVAISADVVRTCLLQLCATTESSTVDGPTLRSLETVLPTEDEARLFRKTHRQLNSTERFLAHVADVPRPRERAAALAFQAELPSRASELEERAESIREACNAVEQCESLPRVLGWVLRLGHWMNNHPVRHPLHVRGLSLPSLSLLWSTKSFQNDVTALGFLVGQLHAVGDGTALRLPEDLSLVSQARMWSLDQLLYDMDQLRTEQASMEAIVRDDARQAGGWARRARTISQFDGNEAAAAGAGGDFEETGRYPSLGGSSEFRERFGSGDDVSLASPTGTSPANQPLTRFVPYAQRTLRHLQKTVDAAQEAFASLRTQLGASSSLPFEEVFGHLHDFRDAFLQEREEAASAQGNSSKDRQRKSRSSVAVPKSEPSPSASGERERKASTVRGPAPPSKPSPPTPRP